MFSTHKSPSPCAKAPIKIFENFYTFQHFIIIILHNYINHIYHPVTPWFIRWNPDLPSQHIYHPDKHHILSLFTRLTQAFRPSMLWPKRVKFLGKSLLLAANPCYSGSWTRSLDVMFVRMIDVSSGLALISPWWIRGLQDDRCDSDFAERCVWGRI